MLNHEHLQTAEKSSGQVLRSSESTTPLTELHAQSMVARRVEMLASIERYIDSQLQRSLREKIVAEEKMLRRLMTTQRKARAAAAQATRLLNRAFFELRPIDQAYFE